MTHVVTGATGFLGRRLAQALRTQGKAVRGLGRNRVLGDELVKEGVAFAAVDLTDAAATKRALDKAEVVYHCAALSSVWGSYRDFFDANVVATRHVVDACRASGVRRLVHVSTPSIYATTVDRLNVREDDPPGSPLLGDYAATKLLAEEEVDAAVGRGLNAITLRPQGLIGRGDPSIFPRFVRANARTGIPTFRDAAVMTDVTHVDNVVRAMMLAGEAPAKLRGRKYNITNGDPRPLLAILGALFTKLKTPMKVRRLPRRTMFAAARVFELAARATKRGEPPLTRHGLIVVAYSRTLCIDAARHDLGYAPGPSIDDAIDEFSADYLQERKTA